MRAFALDNQPFLTRCAVWLRRCSPKLLTLLILLFSIAPTYIPGYSSVRPAWVLVPIFYWALYRPYSFSVVSAFLTGLALDLLESTPLGVNTLTFTVLYIVTETQRRFLTGKTFSLVWAGFAILSFGAYFLKWFFVSVCLAVFTPIGSAFVSCLLLVLAYPAIVWPCAKLHIYLLDKEK